ncbi:MAG: orotidine-5'-phosphate decarboxylase [Candidatus Wallbacteria bacterium]|nr:orotidine-5'-phosphate decarboxylase [Candidatus Wallbacteria bacterium]
MNKTELILALDLVDLREIRLLLKEIDGHVSFFKIGLKLFLAHGREALRTVRDHGRIFLDLKFHDIPNTVHAAVKEACAFGVDLIDVHTGGGAAMMRAAVAAAQGSSARIIGVTVLTSLSDDELQGELQCRLDTRSMVTHLADMAKKCGLHGVVASPMEIEPLRRELGPDFLIATPGIRITSGGDDQKRTMGPREAAAAGADYIIVGRPVLEAEDRLAALKMINEQLKEAFCEC